MLTMQQTKEAILAMLGGANGLKTQPYGPDPSELEKYLAPGNYANAENFERGAEGGKFNWVAYSAFGEKDYLNSQDLAAKLDLLFSDNKLCQNVHITIYQNEDEMAHRVDYRFYTFGVEDSECLDGLDFCPSCGWNMQQLK